MSRYIDGDAFFSEVTNSYRWATGEARKAYRNVLDMICDADNKDVEEVIRCKDCLFFETTEAGQYFCAELCALVKTDGYCYHAIRKEKEE